MKTSRWLFLVCVSFFLQSCTPYVVLTFFNRTKSDISIQTKNQQTIIPKNASGELHHHSLTSNFLFSVNFHDRLGGESVKKYLFVPIPQTYVRPLVGRLKGYEILLQVEENGFVYLVAPKSNMPIRNFEPQPNGYPLKPFSE